MKSRRHDISTTYLGIPLRSPLIPSASPLSRNIAALEEMERRGAGAVVFHSLFEEQFVANPATRQEYCEQITLAKKKLSIPVIGSLSARTASGWADLAYAIEQAGADALELNVFETRLSTTVPPGAIEAIYIETVQKVVASVRIPVSVKLPPFFTNLAYITKELEEAGAKGFVLFNRFYLPETNLRTLAPEDSLKLSSSAENRLSLRWISLLYRPIQADLVANTGIRTGADVLKMILAGAAATELCAVLLQRGISWLDIIHEELRAALTNANMTSLTEARGTLAHNYLQGPGAIEREEYQNALQGYAQFDAPTWAATA
ncbi:MAG TPA: hypothetical protein VGC39_11475 [Candidatus Methylacidiphilales bacterium]